MYKRIVVALDGSEQSCKALDHAVAIAEKLGSELILLTVVPRAMFPFFTYGGFGSTIDVVQYQERCKDFYQDALAKGKAMVRFEHPNLNVSTMLREGHPSATIVDVAENEGYDLIVMGSRGIRGIMGFILGSTSSEVVDSCKKPVLIIKTS